MKKQNTQYDTRKKKNEYITATKRVDVWQNPITKALLSGFSIPFLGEMVKSGIEKQLQEYQREKLEQLLQTILEDNEITSEQLQDVAVIIEFRKLLEVVLRLHHNDKIEYLANLFKNNVKKNEFDYNIYDEFLIKLQNISYRELDLLFLLYEIEQESNLNITSEQEVELSAWGNKVKVWEQFLQRVRQEKHLHPEYVTALMSGLMGSGFVQSYGIPVLSATVKTVYGTTEYFAQLLRDIL